MSGSRGRLRQAGGSMSGAGGRENGLWRRLAIGLVRLYPVAWRRRYADEMKDLLESVKCTPGRCWDLLRGALDAHLHPQGSGEGLHMEPMTRSAGWLLFAFAGFIVAGFAYNGMMDDNLTQWAASGSGALLAYHLIQAGAAVFAVAAAVAAWPIITSGVRNGDRTALAWLAVPCGLAIIFAVGLAALVWIARTNADAAGAGRWLFVALQLYLCAGILVSAHAARRFLQRTRPAGGILNKALWPCTIAVASMGFMLATTAAFGLVARSSRPELFGSGLGVFGLNFGVNWGLVLCVMGLCTGVAIAQLANAWQQAREAEAR